MSEHEGLPSGMSFDEFRNMRARERSRVEKDAGDKDGEAAGKSKGVSASKTGQSTVTKNKVDVNKKADSSTNDSSGGGLGVFLEMPQFQSFVCVLLMLDIFAVTSALILGNYIAALNSTGNPMSILESSQTPGNDYNLFFGLLSWQMIYDSLGAFSSFTLVFFAFEVALVIVAFGSASTSHWGYLLDGIIVSIQIYGELFNWGKIIHLFNFIRYWRLLRLQSFMINKEVLLHNTTKNELDILKLSINKITNNLKRTELEVMREKEARIAVDEMLLSYKDEVETLNEALKIAAMDIAEVAEADDDLLSDDDDLDEQMSSFGVGVGSVIDDEGYSDAPGSKRDKAMNKASMLREARRDNASSVVGSTRGGGSSVASSSARSGKSSGAITFVVQNDGSYEQK